jgi:signal transduction histidine kinase
MTRQPDLVELLHLLGHELRSPAGVLVGYLRMLQEGRVTGEADRLRTYDKMRAALSRVAGLGDAVSQLTSWIEPRERTAVLTDARELIDRSVSAARTALDRPIDAHVAVGPGEARIRVLDSRALEAAVTSIIHGTAREAGDDSPVGVRASIGRDREPAVELIVGPRARVEAEGFSLSDQALGPFSVARGGMGLSLVLAIAVLDAHAAQVWCIGGAQSIAAVRLPVAVEELQP